VMPALQKAKPAAIGVGGLTYDKVEIPTQKRATRIVKDVSSDEIAKEIVEWMKA
jgi:electron transfer flavoprotein beta subunit